MPTGPGRDCHDVSAISESRAAVAYAIRYAESRYKLMPNDVITNVDQGGHTFDITTAKLRHTSPLRVGEDVIPEEGTIFGMQAINDNLRELLKVKVTKKPTYGSLEDRFDKLEKIFEQFVKSQVRLDGTDEPHSLGYEDTTVELSVQDLRSIFKPLIDRAVMFITSHLDKVVTKTGRASDYFILTGGGGSCWPMRDAIWKALNQRYPKMRLVDAISKPDSVASGAILQVLDASYDEERVYNLNLYIRWKVPRDQAEYYLTPEVRASLKGKKGVYHVEEDNHQYFDLSCCIAEIGHSDTSTRRGDAMVTVRTPDRGSVIYEADVAHHREVNPEEKDITNRDCIDCEFFFEEVLWWTAAVGLPAIIPFNQCKEVDGYKLHTLSWSANKSVLDNSHRTFRSTKNGIRRLYECKFRIQIKSINRELIMEVFHLQHSQDGKQELGVVSVLKETISVAPLFPPGYLGGL